MSEDNNGVAYIFLAIFVLAEAFLFIWKLWYPDLLQTPSTTTSTTTTTTTTTTTPSPTPTPTTLITTLSTLLTTTSTTSSSTSSSSTSSTSTSSTSSSSTSSSTTTKNPGTGNFGPVWAIMPTSWCSEYLYVKKENGNLYCEMNDLGNGCNFRPYGDNKPNNPKWYLLAPERIKNEEYAQLSWYAVNDNSCTPHCPLPDKNKLLKDGPGTGCGANVPQ